MSDNIHTAIRKLICYGLENNLITAEDRIYTANALIHKLGLDEYAPPDENFCDVELEPVLADILDYAVENGIIEDSIVYKDLFDTEIMGCLTPRPSEVKIGRAHV